MAEFQGIGANLASNPGSYNEFLARTGMQPGPEAIEALSTELDKYKEDLIAVRGLDSLEELHTVPLDFVRPERATTVGTIALAG